MNTKLPLILTLITISILVGCRNYYELTDQQKQLANALKDVTQKYVDDNFGKSVFGGKAFCAYQVLDIEAVDGGKYINEYLWATCQEYYLKHDKLETGRGIGLPIALFIQLDGTYKINSQRIPRDGSMYSYDIENIFPKRTHKEIFAHEIADRLVGQTRQEAEDYYKKERHNNR
ncbi:MAG: hypothetical protein QOH25_3985 [Acidobacteriota bacterium]|jgi:hypothetical protein|nr:hypothetical protein [Acidobacteriota bacterium]